MDSGLEVQWPLSPFATAIATGALFTFCVVFWNKRTRNQPDSAESNSRNTSLRDGSQYAPEHCCAAVRRHVLKLEIPNVIDTSAFSFPSISSLNEADIFTFALPRIRESRDVTLKLIDFDGKLSKVSIGPFLREKVKFEAPFPIFTDALLCSPKLEPRQGLTFRVNTNPDWLRPFLRNPFCYPIAAVKNQESFPPIFKKYNQLNVRFLETVSKANLLGRFPENISYFQNCSSDSLMSPNHKSILLESEAKSKNKSDRNVLKIINKMEEMEEMKENDNLLNSERNEERCFETDYLKDLFVRKTEIKEMNDLNQNVDDFDLMNRKFKDATRICESKTYDLSHQYSCWKYLDILKGSSNSKINQNNEFLEKRNNSVVRNIDETIFDHGSDRENPPESSEKDEQLVQTKSSALLLAPAEASGDTRDWTPPPAACAKETTKCPKMSEDLEGVQVSGDKKRMTPRKREERVRVNCTIREECIPRKAIETRGKGCGEGTTTNDRDVRGEGGKRGVTSRSRAADEREERETPQMDRRAGERSERDSCVFETSIISETRIQENGGSHVSAVTSSVTVDSLDVWPSNGVVKTVVTADSEVFRPTYEEYMPDESKSLDATINELKEIAGRPLASSEPSSPRVTRLNALLCRDEERRARMKLKTSSGGAGASIEGEWDRILRDVLASVSELEHWEKDEEQRRRGDVTTSKIEDADKLPRHQSSPNMEGEASVLSPTKGETPTKVKNLRFKLDPDVFDVPSDDSFYDDDDDDVRRPGWRRQTKYRAFSTLELGDEPVKLVSVHASVVPAGQKMVARPVGIDLHVRLTDERQSKRAHVGTSPSQVKRRSPVSDTRVAWYQELSPVTENVDWRETFTSVPKETPEVKPAPNGILKSPSPKSEGVVKDSENPFKVEGKLTNGTPVVPPKKAVKPKSLSNGVPWKPPEKKLFSLPRKKFIPDPEAVDRITGYKIALSKPPLPPPVINKGTSIRISRAEIARKQYLDSKAALSATKTDSNKKFQNFLAQAQSDRARIVTSVPDLGAIEKAVSEQWAKERASQSPAREDLPRSGETTSSRGSTPDDAWSSYVQSCRKHLGRRSQSMSYLETDIVDIPILEDDDKWRSTGALIEPDNSESSLPLEDSVLDRSQDDLDDSGRAKSEAELRIQRSLQSLPLPSWYKKSEKPKSGFLLGSRNKEKQGWEAAKSLASSTSSLASIGLKRPVRSLRSSRENIPWSRSSPSPDGPALSLALAKAFREPYLGWRARTSTSSGVSSSSRTSPPSWSAATTDEEANGISFDGEDAFGRTSSQDNRQNDPPSLDDTGADVATVSMDTGDLGKLPGGEDTCDDINNMSMDTCELFDVSIVPDPEEEPSPQADTGDDIDNLSTDTTEDKRKDPKFKRYSYSQSIYNSEWEDDEETKSDLKSPMREGSPSSDTNKVIWIESSFVGSRTTTSIVVMPDGKKERERSLERPASR